jgi:hypothetical protein
MLKRQMIVAPHNKNIRYDLAILEDRHSPRVGGLFMFAGHVEGK